MRRYTAQWLRSILQPSRYDAHSKFAHLELSRVTTSLNQLIVVSWQVSDQIPSRVINAIRQAKEDGTLLLMGVL
jgi:hypothetical protein